MSALPREKLEFFRLNARVGRDYIPCGYCKAVLTRGRDWLGDGQCDQCLIEFYAPGSDAAKDAVREAEAREAS